MWELRGRTIQTDGNMPLISRDICSLTINSVSDRLRQWQIHSTFEIDISVRILTPIPEIARSAEINSEYFRR
jgi:hypothetical protein